jgi:hypothetical protein
MARINISQILFKRGNTASAGTYVGPVGEIIIDTGLGTLRVQDGITPGGHPMASPSDFGNINSTLANLSAACLAPIRALETLIPISIVPAQAFIKYIGVLVVAVDSVTTYRLPPINGSLPRSHKTPVG